MPTRVRTGKLPAQPARPHLRLALALAPSLPTAPEIVDYYTTVDVWGMLANDRLGVCVIADMGHVVEQDTDFASGSEQVVSDSDTVALYSAITGYDPDDPNSDQGTYVQDALTYWRKTGIYSGHKIAAFASVTLDDWQQIENAVNGFGSVTIGFNFPDSAMDQFDAGEPWTVVPGAPAPVDGHCVLLVGYDADWLYVVTWGQVQKMDRKFWAKYVDEAWVVITQDTINSQGANAYGGILDLAALGAAFAALTGQPNPFPNVDPTPVPDPTPTPVPDPTPTPTPTPVDSADQTLWDKVKHWTHESHIGGSHSTSQALRSWAKAKGLR